MHRQDRLVFVHKDQVPEAAAGQRHRRFHREIGDLLQRSGGHLAELQQSLQSRLVESQLLLGPFSFGDLVFQLGGAFAHPPLKLLAVFQQGLASKTGIQNRLVEHLLQQPDLVLPSHFNGRIRCAASNGRHLVNDLAKPHAGRLRQAVCLQRFRLFPKTAERLLPGKSLGVGFQKSTEPRAD